MLVLLEAHNKGRLLIGPRLVDGNTVSGLRLCQFQCHLVCYHFQPPGSAAAKQAKKQNSKCTHSRKHILPKKKNNPSDFLEEGK